MAKKCKHDATMGGVGAKMHFCLDCETEVVNKNYRGERIELAYAKKHPNANTPVAISIRRMKEVIAGKGRGLTLDEVKEKLEQGNNGRGNNESGSKAGIWGHGRPRTGKVNRKDV